MPFDELRREIRDEVGVDAYACFDQERYALEEHIIGILIDAIIVEFLNGFFDFKTLGKVARERIDQFLDEYRQGPKVVTLNIRQDVDMALSLARLPSETESEKATAGLTSALVDYGMDEQVARSHALSIQQEILSSLERRQIG